MSKEETLTLRLKKVKETANFFKYSLEEEGIIVTLYLSKEFHDRGKMLLLREDKVKKKNQQ